MNLKEAHQYIMRFNSFMFFNFEDVCLKMAYTKRTVILNDIRNRIIKNNSLIYNLSFLPKLYKL